MTDDHNEERLREDIVGVMQAMARQGLNRGTSGNVSARAGRRMLITPSGVVPEKITPESIVLIGEGEIVGDGMMRPSSEWRMHWQLMQRRPDIQAIIHCHARFATTLACANQPIPPLHYMVAVSGSSGVPVAPYATFGTKALADMVVDTMGSGLACLMANHGLVALGPSLRTALAIAEEIEEQAAVYWGTLAIGGPTLLDDDQMSEVMDQFAGYGQK